jgi:hypothetical protein
VKTRLMPTLSAKQAAQVHAAMLDCVLQRVAEHLPGRHLLALAGAEPGSPAPGLPAGWAVLDQGTGTLGDRLEHVWRQLPAASPVVFLGVDSPDVPAEALAGIGATLSGVDAALGPVDDGGYWALAAARRLPALVRGIDWGTAAVYHQTRSAADAAGLQVRDLPRWHDVDTPADLADLQRRLKDAQEPALVALRDRLAAFSSHGLSP